MDSWRTTSNFVEENRTIIVCAKKNVCYGEYLANLISGMDDNSVAAVWTEEEYESNRAQLSSTEKIVFICDGKLCRRRLLGAEVKDEAFGMVYAEIGNKRILAVKDPGLGKNYQAFSNLAKSYDIKLERVHALWAEERNYKKNGTIGAFGPIHGTVNLVGAVARPFVRNKIKQQKFELLVKKYYLDILCKQPEDVE